MATEPLSGAAAHGAAFTSDTSPLTCTQAQPTHARLVTSRREHLVSCPHTRSASHSLCRLSPLLCRLRRVRAFSRSPEPPTAAEGCGAAGLLLTSVKRCDILPSHRELLQLLFSSHSRPPPAGGLCVHRHTCWARVGGQITGWADGGAEINDSVIACGGDE